MPSIPDYIVKSFQDGVFTRLEKESIPKGAASDALNWLTFGDHTELRRGQNALGNAISGVGKITGLIIAKRFDGVEVPIRTRGVKYEIYDVDTNTWVESTYTDIMPLAASGEDVSFSQYHSLAGAMVYGTSANSGAYKIMLANPRDVLDQAITDHRGKTRIKNGRSYLWDRKDTNNGSDKTGLYGSWIDKDELSDYTEVTGEAAGTGNGVLTTFTGTLTMQKSNKTFTVTAATDVFASVAHGFNNGDPLKFSSTTTLPAPLVAGKVYYVINKNTDDYQVAEIRNGTPVDLTDTGTGTHTATFGVTRTVMYPRFTDGKEQFQDDRDGNLIGSKGGTGTINYATGAFSITFNTAVANLQAITATYYWEDATSEGVLDYSKSAPRAPGEGFVLRQDDGGAEFQNLATFAGKEYCLHTFKTWALTLATDDANAAQEIYRNRVGIPYWRAMAETGEGIYYVDDSDAINPFINLLQYGYGGQNVVPKEISKNIDLSVYEFDNAEVKEWGLYIVISCRTKNSTVNNRMLFYHRLWNSWDITDYRNVVSGEYAGGLVGGDSGSDNVFSLFDSFSDEDTLIPNYWNDGERNLDVEGSKRVHRFVIKGLISISQILKIRFAFDNGTFVELGQIRGDGAADAYGIGGYVDLGSEITIGSRMFGSQLVGGEGSITASPYAREITINSPKFENVILQIEATEIGYVSMSEYQYKDIRYKGRKLPVQYRG
jgi:hypothetical protein